MHHRLHRTGRADLLQCTRCREVDAPELMIGFECYGDYDQVDYQNDVPEDDRLIAIVFPAVIMGLVTIMLLYGVLRLDWNF